MPLKIADVYAKLVIAGVKLLEEVPENIREEVRSIIKQSEESQA